MQSIARLSGANTFTFRPTILSHVESGPGSIAKLPKIMAALSMKTCLIVTGNSLATKTDVISKVQQAITSESGFSVAAVHSKIGAHAPIADIRAGLELLSKHSDTDSIGLVAVGGGSPIDSAKVMIKTFEKENNGKLLKLISIPTTLSAAELTIVAGFTDEQGKKTGIKGSNYTSSAVIYDAELSLATPNSLWLSTGIRSLDHAIETQNRANASIIVKALAREAVATLFEALPACHGDATDVEARQRAFTGALTSLWSDDLIGALGLSHALGYLLGAPYSIAHGTCSCLTLSLVIDALANVLTGSDLRCMASLYDFLPEGYKSPATDDVSKVKVLSQAVDKLVKDLGVDATMERVPKEDVPTIVATGLKMMQRPNDPEDAVYQSLLKGLLAKY